MSALPSGEVHVWRAPLDVGSPLLSALEATLSADERQRAARFLAPRDRDRFVAARGVLRRLLGEYLDADPARLGFRYGEHGKPELDGAWAGAGLRFNLSHCGGRALLAFAREREVGVDLEAEREVSNAERVASRVFPAPELQWWRELPEEQRRAGFFRVWTRLEAVAKLHGEGVWRIVRGQAVADPEALTALELEAAPGYAAALAVEGRGMVVRQRAWRG